MDTEYMSAAYWGSTALIGVLSYSPTELLANSHARSLLWVAVWQFESGGNIAARAQVTIVRRWDTGWTGRRASAFACILRSVACHAAPMVAAL